MTDPLPSLPSGLHFIVRQIKLVTRVFVTRIKLAAGAVIELTRTTVIHGKTNITIMCRALIGCESASRHLLHVACCVRSGVAASSRILVTDFICSGGRAFTRTFQDAPGINENAHWCTREDFNLAQGTTIAFISGPLANRSALQLDSPGDSFHHVVLVLSLVRRPWTAQVGPATRAQRPPTHCAQHSSSSSAQLSLLVSMAVAQAATLEHQLGCSWASQTS